MKKKPSSLFFRVLVALVLAVAAPAAARAQPYIDDVLLIGGDASDVLTRVMKYQKNGWKAIGKDLNSGAGGDYIHLLYKPASSNDGFNYGSITGFYIHSKSTNSLPDKTKTIGGRTYYLVPCEGGSDFVNGRGDLNEGCGTDSDYIYLYYTRDPFPDNRVVTGITFNATQSGALGTNGGSLGYDLNNGAGGDYIYMHVTTATALEPLRIGDGSSGTNNIPFYLGNDYYPYSVSQQIYTAEDIGMAGSVKAISFYHRMDDMSLTMNGVQIYMKHTDKNAFSGAELDPMDDFVKVFEGKISISGAGWMTIRLDEPFTYDGNSNLMICCYDPVGVHPKGNTFTYHFADNKMRRLASHDPINLQETLVGPVNTTMRNDIQLNIVPNAYPNPVKLTVNGFTDKSASVSWSAPKGTHPAIKQYKWQYKKSEDADWSALASTTGTTAELSGLSAFTEYMFRVRILYAGGQSSYSVFRFVTAVSLPYTCGFENGMPGWSQVDYNHWLNIDYTGISEDARHDGAYGYMFDAYAENPVPQYLLVPGLPNNVPMTLSFFYRNFASSNFETFQLGYSTTTRDISAFTWGEEITVESAEWQQGVNNFPAGTQYVAIKYSSNKYRLYLDDFEIVAYSSYEKPRILSENTITDQSATLSWSAPEGATGYAYTYRRVDGGDWAADNTVKSTSVTLENLTANTTYDFRVRALFGHYSSNAVNYRFMTEGPMEALPHDQGFENGMGGWRLVNGNGRTGITTREHHEGAYSFEFDEGSPHAQFLRSPLLEGNAPKVVSFYFKNFSEEAGESVSVGYRSAFQVGWSTKSNRLEDFVVTPEEEAFNGRWTRYTLQLPEDTRYVLIMVKDHEAWLYVDDISIAEVPKPVAMLATVMGERKYVTTFYDPAKKWQLPEGALAYTVHQEGEDYVFYCIDDVVRAGTPVVIMMDKLAGDTEDTKEIDLSVTGASGRAPHLYNILRGAEAPVAVSGGKVDGKTVYVLGIVEGKLGFYQFSGSVIPAGKAYYLAE